MNKALRILHLEDEADFSDLVQTLLEREGFEVDRQLVDNLPDFEAALVAREFDAVLADYMLPTCTGLEALQSARAKCPETPFLLVSGTIGEQAAIQSLKSGATDYVLKLWPERLAPAVRRAVQEAEEKRQRQQMETELVRREKYFRTLTENALDILTVLNGEGLYLYNSPSLKRVLGYEPSELVGREAFSFIHPDDTSTAQGAFEEAIKHPDRPARVEFRFRHQDGSWRYLEAVGQSHLADPAIGGVVINSRDITDRKQAELELRASENQLRQAQKMEAIGQLAGGVAHDFNNILTVIHGHASLLLAKAHLAGDNARSAQQIAQAAERAAGLTRQLLAFGRRQIIQPRPLDVNEVVANMTKMVSRVLGEDIALELKYLPRPAVILADAGMIEQVLLNLVVNAREAMPKGGSLRLTIENVKLGTENLGNQPEARAGDFACLAVSDTGCGIAPENLRRIFEPFFTTKEVGRGTGLGLATAYGIVKQHAGWIEVESQPGRGSTFKVLLPRFWQPAQSLEAFSEGKALVRGGDETILVVEDEAPVRELVCNLLASYGYKVVPAESGIQAVELWNESGKTIDLLLTDLIMPDRMNGRELAERLWKDRPELKVIFTSGYGSDVVGKAAIAQGRLNYLQKPYPPSKLAIAVRDCLDGMN